MGVSTLAWAQKNEQVLYFNAQGDSVGAKNEASTYRVVKTLGRNRSIIEYNAFNDAKIEEFYYKKDLNVVSKDSVWYRYGAFKKWFPSGQIKTEGTFVYDRFQDDLKTYYPSGKLRRHDVFHLDTLLKGRCFNERGDTVPHFAYYQNPEYKNGQKELFQFLGNTIRYPHNARTKGIEGTVYVGFVVDTIGQIVNVKIRRGVHQSIDEEAIRVVKKMPKWEPGRIDGELARVAYTLPIKFKLE